MSLQEYENFVYRSCMVDKEDPVAEWKSVHFQQKSICDTLDQANEIRIVGEDTDLTLKVTGRKWINCSGKINMPDGEIFTGPIENSANGTIRFTFPGIVANREVKDITLVFSNGAVAKASASEGEELLSELLKIDGANRIGEFAIGTNYGIDTFTKEILFDEKMGGTMHIALGNSYPESGGVNVSTLHWDILKDMKSGEIYVDSKLLYKDGRFRI